MVKVPPQRVEVQNNGWDQWVAATDQHLGDLLYRVANTENAIQAGLPTQDVQVQDEKLQRMVSAASEQVAHSVEEAEKFLEQQRRVAIEETAYILNTACQKAQAEILGITNGIQMQMQENTNAVNTFCQEHRDFTQQSLRHTLGDLDTRMEKSIQDKMSFVYDQ